MLPPANVHLRAERYGITGVADVITHFTLSQVPGDNLIRVAIERELVRQGVTVPAEFEVIVDYKGAGRPDQTQDYWVQHNWQIQMYAWLRARQPESKPVIAGIVMYVNELLPSAADVMNLRGQMATGRSDVLPERGSEDYYVLTTARSGSNPGRELSESFRLKRVLRVITVTEASIAAAGIAFDDVVVDIESRISQEIMVGDISQAWAPSCQDADTCAACDVRYFCPKPHGKDVTYQIEPPPVP